MSNSTSQSCPQSSIEVLNTYFMEHRAKLLDIAAYLDRIDRASGDTQVDFRDAAFREAIAVLASSEPHRTKRILELFSDHSTDIPQSAQGMKGALGVVKPNLVK